MSDEENEPEFGSGSSRRNSLINDNVDVVDSEYYNFLNVPRTASEVEINAAYKKLSRLYHPDKHLDEEKKKKAEILFAKLKLAHEVLSDPHKRAIYDCLGKKGLKEQGWEIVQRTKSPREIRDEYEKLANERAERMLNQRTNPTSRLQMTINATDLFERYLYDEEFDDVIEGGLPSFEVTEISFNQTINCPITNADNVVLSGNVSTVNGNGHGSVGCAWKTVLSDRSSRDLEFSFGTSPHVGAKYYRRFTERVFVNMSGTMQFTSKGLQPGVNVSFGNQFSKSTVGYLTYSTNWRVEEAEDALALSEEQSGMATMIIHNTPKYHLMGTIQFGIPYTYVMFSVTRKFEDAQNKLRGTFKLGTFGAIMEYGVETKVTKQSVIGATMVVGIPVGVTLRIKVTRAQQTYLFPIHLTDEILMQPIFYGTVVPLVTWYTFKKLVLDPFEARKKAKDKDRQMRLLKEKIVEAKKEAEASVDLMRERYLRIRGDEVAKNGIVIVAALYGIFMDDLQLVSNSLDDLTDLAEEEDEELDLKDLVKRNPEVIDVTVPIQCLVEENSRINIFEGTKSDLAGFYDPSPTESEKKLLVRYRYQNYVHQTVIRDEEALKLPKTNHRLNSR